MVRNVVVLPTELGPNSAKNWPRLDLEAETVKRAHAAIGLGDVGKAERRAGLAQGSRADDHAATRMLPRSQHTSPP